MHKQNQNNELGTKIINFYEHELNKHFELLNDYFDIINNNIIDKKQVNIYIKNIEKYYISYFLSILIISIPFIYIFTNKYNDFILNQLTLLLILFISVIILEINLHSKHNLEIINKYLRSYGDKKFIHFNKFNNIMNTNNRIALSINNVKETLKNVNNNSNLNNDIIYNNDIINNNHIINNIKELNNIRNRNNKTNLNPNVYVNSNESINNYESDSINIKKNI